jgi:hypothetical protein
MLGTEVVIEQLAELPDAVTPWLEPAFVVEMDC